MKKNLKKILIPVIILGFLLAPVSPILKNKNGNLTAGVEINKARATLTCGVKIVNMEITNIASDGMLFTFNITVNNPSKNSNGDDKIEYSTEFTSAITGSFALDYQNYMMGYCSNTLSVDNEANDWNGFIDHDTSVSTDGKYYVPSEIFSVEITETGTGEVVKTVPVTNISMTDYDQKVSQIISGLQKNTKYSAKMLVHSQRLLNLDYSVKFPNDTGTFTTKNDDSQIGAETTTTETIVAGSYITGCSLDKFDLSGCIADFFYIIWEVSAKVMHLAGKFLDFFLYYTTNSSAYTSVFVEKGWGIIRDVANIFFIIALLYVAIKTILSLNVTNNKKLIGTIVLIALLINFSLFITQVIIDGSNILAKVFYNQVTTVNEDQTTATAEAGGEKSISVNLVKGFNPQMILTEGAYKALGENGNNVFIFITIMLIFLTLYAAYMFFVVSILFIGRVVALWLAMIFAPFAFISYAIPFEIPFHHKQWWKDLLQNAFMAPIFIFFLYIIILFIKFGKEAVNVTYGTLNTTSSVSLQDVFQNIMSVLIPFAIIFLLLTRAKKLAVDYSGELGKMLSKIGGTVVKVGGGAVLGAAAVMGGGALRATVGRAGSAVAGTAWAKETRFGRAVGGLAGKFGKASFDIRGAKIAGKTLAGVTGLKAGEAQKGGFEKAKADRVAKRQKRAEELKVGEHEPLKTTLYKEQADLRGLQVDTNKEIASIDKEIETARQKQQDVSRMANKSVDSVTGMKKEDLQQIYSNKLSVLTGQKAALRNGLDYSGKTYKDFDKDGKLADVELDKNEGGVDYSKKYGGRNLKKLEQAVKTAEFNIESAEYERINKYAKASSSKFANIMTGITGGSWEANIEAANKMKANLKPPKEENVK